MLLLVSGRHVGAHPEGPLRRVFKQRILWPGSSRDEGETRAVGPSREEGELVSIPYHSRSQCYSFLNVIDHVTKRNGGSGDEIENDVVPAAFREEKCTAQLSAHLYSPVCGLR